MVHVVGAEFIEINGPWLAVVPEIRAPEAKDGEDAFMLGKLERNHPTGGVVDRGQQAHLGRPVSVLKPMVVGTVKLNHLAKTGFSFSPCSVDGCVLFGSGFP